MYKEEALKSTDRDAIIATLFYVISTAAVIFTWKDFEPRPLSAFTVLPTMSLTLTLALGLYFSRRSATILKSAPPREQSLREKIREILTGAATGILLFPLTFLLSWLTNYIIVSLGLPPPRQQLLVESLMHPDTTFAAKTIAAFSAIIIAPVSEEILNRWAIAGTIARRWNHTTAIIASSLFFSLLHLNLSSSLGIFAIGLTLAVIYFRTGSLIAPITAHATYNTVSFIAMLI